MAGKGFITGYEDGTLRLENKISRAEAVQIIVNAFSLSDSRSGLTFIDTNNHWVEKSEVISTAQEFVMIKGDDSGIFRPNDTITRAEVAQIIEKTADIKPVSDFTMNFKDRNQVLWVKDAIITLHSYKFTNGKEGNLFDPKG